MNTATPVPSPVIQACDNPATPTFNEATQEFVRRADKVPAVAKRRAKRGRLSLVKP